MEADDRATGGGPRAAAAAGGGRDRPQPANAQRTAQAPRASGDVDVERGARRAVPPSPRVSRTVSTQRQRAPVSARDTTDYTVWPSIWPSGSAPQRRGHAGHDAPQPARPDGNGIKPHHGAV